MLPHSIEINGPTRVVLIAIVLTFSLQLLLCFQTRRCLVRAVPMAICAIMAVVFSILSACARGWDGFGYLFFALLFPFLALVSGLTWMFCAFMIPTGGKLP